MGAQHLRAHTAPQAVGSDQGSPLELGIVLASDVHRGFGQFVRRQPCTEVDAHTGLRLYRLEQHAVQVGTVDGGIGLTIAGPDHGAQAQLPERLAAVCIAHLQVFGEGGSGVQWSHQAPFVEHTHRVGPQLQARPHLTQCTRLLQQVHRHTGPCQRQRASQTSNATASDHHVLCHGRALCPRDRTGP